MLKVRAKDLLRLDQRKNVLKKTAPLMRSIAKARRQDFDRRYEKELRPDDKPIRDLTEAYQNWKNKKYPGKKKRELTGATRASYQVKITDRALQENVGGAAVWLQYFLDLPLLTLPDDADLEELKAIALEFALKAMTKE